MVESEKCFVVRGCVRVCARARVCVHASRYYLNNPNRPIQQPKKTTTNQPEKVGSAANRPKPSKKALISRRENPWRDAYRCPSLLCFALLLLSSSSSSSLLLFAPPPSASLSLGQGRSRCKGKDEEEEEEEEEEVSWFCQDERQYPPRISLLLCAED